MSSGGENESEILLGNKQLLAIFFVIAFLLFVAFTGGYMIGRGGLPEKKTVVAAAAPTPETQPKDSGLETHSLGPAEAADEANSDAKVGARPAARPTAETESVEDQAPLGSPKQKAKSKAAAARQAEAASAANASADYEPQTGQIFLQVTALARDDAYGVAEVLTQKGFHAHSVPKPGNGKLYRVLVGPIRDTAELATTREALRKNTGFQDVIVQRY